MVFHPVESPKVKPEKEIFFVKLLSVDRFSFLEAGKRGRSVKQLLAGVGAESILPKYQEALHLPEHVTIS